MQAAIDYAEGRPVSAAPPSLRLYALAKRLPGVLGSVDMLDAPQDLWIEFEVYAAEEARVARESAQRQDRQARKSGSSRLPSRRRGRN